MDGATRITRALYILLLTAASAAHAQQPEPQLSGRVVQAASGAPIVGATVVLNSGRPNGREGAGVHTTKTDSSGAFSLRGVADGTYSITAFAEGFLADSYQAGGLPNFRETITAATRLSGIDFRLRRPAEISGVVVNAAGAPLNRGIKITPVRVATRADGSTQYLTGGSDGTTDAEGRFTISSLKADRYLVCVNCAIRVDRTIDSTGGIVDFGNQGLTWYGDTPAVAAALPITVAEGESRSGVRIVAGPMRLHNVIIRPVGPGPEPVRIPGIRDGAEPPESYVIQLAGRGERAEKLPDGSYIMRNLTPGHYTLTGYAKLHAVDIGAGEANIDITDADGDVTVQMEIGGFGSVQGVAKWDGVPNGLPQVAAPATACRQTDPAAVCLVMDWGGGNYRGSWPWMASLIGANGGSFSFANVLPGTYVFRLETKVPGVVLQSVRCNGTEVTTATPLRVGDRQQVTTCEVTVKKSSPGERASAVSGANGLRARTVRTSFGAVLADAFR